MSEPMEVIIAGRSIGLAIGWDQHDTSIIGFTAFVASDEALKVGLCNGDLIVNFADGRIQISDDNGNEMIDVDLVDCLSQIKKIGNSP